MLPSLAVRYFIILLLCCGACSGNKEPEPTAIIDEEGLTPAIRAIIPDSVLQRMKAMGMPIYGGNNPADLTGVYWATPLTLVSSNHAGDFPGKGFLPMKLDFSNQNNELLTVDVSYDQQEEQGSGIASYLVGNECQFSVFTPIEGVNNDYPFEAIYVFSGTVAPNGIEEFYLANFLLDDFGAPEGLLINVGEGRVIKDEEGMALREGIEESDLFSALPDCPCNFEEAKRILGPTASCPQGEWKNCDGASSTFHYGATDEVRWVPTISGAPGQQCTYDQAGNLITGGIAAGSPDKISPGGECDQPEWLVDLAANFACVSAHCEADVRPWEAIPCWRYLSEWPANSACGTENVISGIEHMRTLVGNMTCEQVTVLLRAAREASPADITTELQGYILGNNPEAFPGQLTLLRAMRDWKDSESLPNDARLVIEIALINLR